MTKASFTLCTVTPEYKALVLSFRSAVRWQYVSARVRKHTGWARIVHYLIYSVQLAQLRLRDGSADESADQRGTMPAVRPSL